MRWNGVLATTIVALLVAASPAAAETFVVNTTDDLTGTCPTPTTCSIRQAIVSSGVNSEPDTIRIPEGQYELSQGPLQVTSQVTIIGDSANATRIDAAPGSRVFQIAGTSASISHLTMANGVATDQTGFFGGNLQAASSTVVLDHVRVTGGNAYSGGGVSNRNGTMTITNSVISNNVATSGGGDGGGLQNFGGDGFGPASLTVRESTIAYNTATKVGAISQWDNAGDTITLESTTIAYNSASSVTGGIDAGAGSISVRGSLLANNTVGLANANCTTTRLTSLGHNVDDGVSCALSGTGDVSDTNANLNPELTADGTLTFEEPSPAMDIGGTCSPTDQIGRPRAGACDAGAWEFRGDTVPPDPPVISDQLTFTSEPDATFECSLNGAAFTACTSPYSTAGLAPGDYVLAVRGVDLAGNRGAASTRSFSVAAQQPVQTPVPTATPAPTPGPEPVRNRSVEATPSGTVLIKDKSGKFVPLKPGVVPNGAEIDAKQGAVTITTSDGESATFSSGRFKVSQKGDLTTATLSEPLDCTKARRGKARAAATKPKTRKLWGSGKGRFRTKGQYSAATVRGTRWLVQDTCTTTLTRVAEGVVSVRDDVRKKSITLRKGKSYTARAKKK
jgi:hypothetical protein